MFAMLTKESQVEIQVLHRQGKGVREIARDLGVSRNTVRRVLRGEKSERYRQRAQRSKLDPYKDEIRARLLRAGSLHIPATVIHREIVARGFGGSVIIVRRFVQTLKPPIVAEPIVRFETPPGKQLQIDFVDFRRGPSALRAFTAELGYSRFPYVEFVDNERTETLIACLERALQYFGGVPAQILCDNPKTIVIERHAYGEGRHRFNPNLLDFSKHYGIEIKLCAPYRSQTKGKVERFHRYLRESFFNPLQSLQDEPLDVVTANCEVLIWLREVAATRVHATLKERPLDRFAREKESLRGLPLPYGGHAKKPAPRISVPMPVESVQHPLALYEAVAKEIAA